MENKSVETPMVSDEDRKVAAADVETAREIMAAFIDDEYLASKLGLEDAIAQALSTAHAEGERELEVATTLARELQRGTTVLYAKVERFKKQRDRAVADMVVIAKKYGDDAARAEQREVDAKVAETMYGEQWDVGYINAGISIAAAIRAMDKPKPEGKQVK